MAQVEVGRTAHLAGVPSVNDGTQAAKGWHAFGVGTFVDRFGVNVVEVELQAMGLPAAQGKLTRMVGTLSDAGPSVQRGELLVVISVGSIDTVDVHASWKAIRIENVEEIAGSEGGRPPIAGKQLIHRLCRGGCGWGLWGP